MQGEPRLLHHAEQYSTKPEAHNFTLTFKIARPGLATPSSLPNPLPDPPFEYDTYVVRDVKISKELKWSNPHTKNEGVRPLFLSPVVRVLHTMWSWYLGIQATLCSRFLHVADTMVTARSFMPYLYSVNGSE